MAKSTRNRGAAKKVSATNLRTFRTFLLMRQFAAQEIGARIAEARKLSGGITQEQLADLLNVTPRTVQNWEAGETIPWKHFQGLTAALGEPMEWFLSGDAEAPEDSPATGGLGEVFLERLEGVVERFEVAVDRLEQTRPEEEHG